MAETEHLSAKLNDEEMIEAWEIVERHFPDDTSKSDILRQLVADAAGDISDGEFTVDAAGEDEEDEGEYDPFDDSTRPDALLDREQIKSVIREHEQPAIHPGDVARGILPQAVSEKRDIVEAVARYYALDEHAPGHVPEQDEIRKAISVVGLDGDSRTRKRYEKVRTRFVQADGVGVAENVEASSVLDVDVDEWRRETRKEFIEAADDRPVAVLEGRRDRAAELAEWGVDVTDVINDINAAIAQKDADSDADEGDESSGEVSEALDALEAAKDKDTDVDEEDDETAAGGSGGHSKEEYEKAMERAGFEETADPETARKPDE